MWNSTACTWWYLLLENRNRKMLSVRVRFAGSMEIGIDSYYSSLLCTKVEYVYQVVRQRLLVRLCNKPITIMLHSFYLTSFVQCIALGRYIIVLRWRPRLAQWHRPYYAIQCWTQDASNFGQGEIPPPPWTPGVWYVYLYCTNRLETKRLTRLSLEYFSTERKSCFKLAHYTACLIIRYLVIWVL